MRPLFLMRLLGVAGLNRFTGLARSLVTAFQLLHDAVVQTLQFVRVFNRFFIFTRDEKGVFGLGPDGGNLGCLEIDSATAEGVANLGQEAWLVGGNQFENGALVCLVLTEVDLCGGLKMLLLTWDASGHTQVDLVGIV